MIANRLVPLVAAIAFVPALAAAAPSYIATDLGMLGPNRTGVAYGLDDNAQVVGESGGSSQSVGAVTGPQGVGVVNFRVGQYAFTTVTAINAIGDTAGTACGGITCAAFARDASGKHLRVFDSFEGVDILYATGINAGDLIVGYSFSQLGIQRAFVAKPANGQMRDLGTLGGESSAAFAINDSGEITGWTTRADGEIRAFLCDLAGRMRDVGPGEGRAINASGQIAGYTSIGVFQAFITGPHGVGFRELANLPGAQGTILVGLNAHGQAVGYEELPGSEPSRAVVTDETGETLTLLDSLVKLPGQVSLLNATAINDQGQIVANGTNRHVYLLTPSTSGI